MYVGKGEVDEITFSLKVSARRSLRTQTAGNTSAFTNHYEVTIKKMNTNKRRTKKSFDFHIAKANVRKVCRSTVSLQTFCS